jgi:spermidine synthase
MMATLYRVFPHVVAIPGDTMHFVAAVDGAALTNNPQVLIARLKQRGLDTHYVSQYFLPFRMAPERMESARTQLLADASTRVNRDFAPVAYYENAVLWSSEFHPAFARWMEAAARVRLAWVVLFAALISLVAALVGSVRGARSTALLCMGSTGFTLMALEIFLLLVFQALYGYVYQELALLVGCMMAGIALGSWWSMKSSLQHTTLLQTGLALSLPFLMVVASLAAKLDGAAVAFAAHGLFPALAAAVGALGGAQFPRLSALFLGKNARGTGLLYAVDLLGGCAAALLVSAYLIPVFGFWPAAWICATLGGGPALSARRLRSI